MSRSKKPVSHGTRPELAAIAGGKVKQEASGYDEILVLGEEERDQQVDEVTEELEEMTAILEEIDQNEEDDTSET